MNHGYDQSLSIILGLRQDVESEGEIEKLKKILHLDFQAKISKISLEEFVDAVQGYVPPNDIEWIESFQRRYLDMSKGRELEEAMKRIG